MQRVSKSFTRRCVLLCVASSPLDRTRHCASNRIHCWLFRSVCLKLTVFMPGSSFMLARLLFTLSAVCCFLGPVILVARFFDAPS
jgi:hypothetical protein